MKVVYSRIWILAIVAVTTRVDGVTFYAATAAGGPGELYTINPATGAIVQDVGPLNDTGALNYGITGLAFNPITGVLYGSTHNLTAANPATLARLVTIDPATAQVTVIGEFSAGNSGDKPATMGDLAFDPAGNLFGVGTVGGPNLYSINLSTGKATLIGSTGLTSTEGGGVEFGPGGTLFGTPNSIRYGTYDKTTGAYTNIVNPTKPVGGAYAALTYDGINLYGLDLGPSSSGLQTHLVTFDPTTGAVTDVAPSVTALDALAATVLVGDYNHNNVVDDADYVVWRKNFSANTAMYDAWRSHFGAVGGAGTGAQTNNGAVPEPSTIALGFCCAFLLATRRSK